MEPKKSILKRIKDKWQSLDEETRDWLKIVAIWTADGALYGSIFTAIKKNKEMEAKVKFAVYEGYRQGQLDAYRDIASENGMKRLEQQGKATRF